MQRLHKKAQTNVRWTPDQLREIEKAVRIESRRRGEIVERAALIRELTLAGVERILSEAQQAA
jgi:hypothetical protein